MVYNGSYCVFHIERNIKTKFRTDVDGLIWKIAKANRFLDFYVAMCDLRRENNIIYDYIAEINPGHWARAHFPVPRFGHGN